MGYAPPISYNIVFTKGSAAPVDSTTYYFSYSDTFTTSPTYGRHTITSPGRIRRVSVAWFNATTDATTENTTIAIRLNDTTNYVVYTGSWANANSPKTIANLNVPLNIGDFIQGLIICPAWATNPNGVYIWMIIEVTP